MTASWTEVTIGEIADIVGGSTPSTKDPDNFGGDIPWVTPKDLSGPHDRYIARGERNLTQQGLDSCSAKLLPAGAVLLSTRAPVGYVAIAKNPIATNQGFRSLIPRDGVFGEYLYYWLSVNTEELERHSSGSTFRELSGTALKSIKLRLPPMGEQRRIAGVLGCLDDKIELNRRMAGTLEEMARALFRSWFVDFEPVRAKQEGRWRSGESLPGLPAQLYEAFPERLEGSALGPIPAGWRVAALGDVVETVRGRSYKSAELADSEVALVTLKSFARGGGYREDGLKPYTGAYKPEQVVEPGEVVLACTDVTQAGEVVGRPAIVQPAPEYAALVASLDTLIIRPRDESVMSRAFLYFLMGTPAFTAHALAHATGTTVLHLAKAAVPNFRFAQPPADLVRAFNAAASAALARGQVVRTEARTLAAQRDTLLVRLIGQPHLTPTPEG